MDHNQVEFLGSQAPIKWKILCETAVSPVCTGSDLLETVICIELKPQIYRLRINVVFTREDHLSGLSFQISYMKYMFDSSELSMANILGEQSSELRGWFLSAGVRADADKGISLEQMSDLSFYCSNSHHVISCLEIV